MNTKFVLIGILAASCLAARADGPVINGQQAPLRDADIGGNTALQSLGKVQRVNDLIGAQVIDSDGEQFAKVRDVALDLSNGRVTEIILAEGNLLSTHRIIAIPPESFTWNDTSKVLQFNVNKIQLRGVPEFAIDKWQEATEFSEIKQVYQRYGATQYFHDENVLQPSKASTTQVDVNAPGFSENNKLPHLGYIARASKLVGTIVFSLENTKLARVEDFIVDLPTGRAVEVVLSGGGIAAENDLTAVPPQSFHWNADQTAMTLDTTAAAIKAAPHFGSHDYDDAGKPAKVQEIYALYHVQPYFASGINQGAQDVRERTSEQEPQNIH